MFYNLISVITVNFFLLFTYAPAAKENKFSIYLAFRETLYKDLFAHIRLYSTVIIVGLITAVVINRVIIGAAGTVGARVKYQRVKIKYSVYIICK